MGIELNREQRKAAERLTGSVLVTAGAGSGKTRMLTERFANTVVAGRLTGWQAIEPGEVVAITYTEKAAGEIGERVRAEIGRSAAGHLGGRDDLWVSTIHGFCARVLRRNPFEAGVDPLFSVAATLETGRLRERAFQGALARLDSEGGQARELLEAYGEEGVFTAVIEIVRQLGVAGLGTEAITLNPPPAVDGLLEEARELFEDGASACEMEGVGASKSLVEHSDMCRELLSVCRDLSARDDSAPADLDAVRSMAEQYSAVPARGGLKDLSEEMKRRKAALLSGIAAVDCARYESALVALTQAFDEIYTGAKREASLLDFEDLQTGAVSLLEQRPEVAAEYRDRFKIVMIDEFQDTDALQLRLVKQVAGEDLCTVGDEMQSIYGFRGADIEVYRQHRREMEDAGALMAELDINYRAHPQILGFINQVFSSPEYSRNSALPLRPNPDGREHQPLDDLLENDVRVEVTFLESDECKSAQARNHEAREIARRIAALTAEGMPPGDVAVLLRAYTDAHRYADALSEQGVPALIVGGGRFLELAEVEVMRSLTRVIANVSDDAALGLLLVSDFIPVTDDTLLSLRLSAGDSRLSLWELIKTRPEHVNEADAAALERIREVVEHARSRVGRDPLDSVLLRAVEEAGYDLRLLEQGGIGRNAFANVAKFARQAAEFERIEGSGPAGFAAYIDDKERLGDKEAPDTAVDEESSAVQIMSIHASKGLEFPVVVVPDIGRGRPTDSQIVRMRRADGELQVAIKTPQDSDTKDKRPNSPRFIEFDERDREAGRDGDERLFYVALTRARDLLLVSGVGALNPKTPPGLNSDLTRLASVLGHAIPLGDERDETLELANGASCRLRVVFPEVVEPTPPAEDPVRANAFPPPVGESLDSGGEQSWLPETISYTQFSEFEECPRRFRIRRVLHIAPPPAVASDEPQPMLVGNALHAALRLVGADGAPPSPTQLDTIARYFELSAEESKRLRDATAAYCASAVAKRASAADLVIREAPISVSIQGRFLIAGSIDLYARTGAEALIVDYKSGTSGEPHELAERYRLQAQCYAFAALTDGCETVDVVFVRPEVVPDGEMETVEFSFVKSDAEVIERDLAARYERIESSEFEPVAGDHCGRCDVPLGLCEHRHRPRRRS